MNVEGIEGDTEHHLADMLVEQLKTETDEDTFVAKVKVLAEMVEHHIEEEEEECFLTTRTIQHRKNASKSANSISRVERFLSPPAMEIHHGIGNRRG